MLERRDSLTLASRGAKFGKRPGSASWRAPEAGRRRAGALKQRPLLLLAVVLALVSCLTLEDGTPQQTAGSPSASDAQMSSGAAGGPGSPTQEGAQNSCDSPGWTVVRVGAQDQAAVWAAPTLSTGCAAAPYRLTASAPRLGVALRLDISRTTGRILDATYVTTGVGPDGEAWGEYEAPIDVASSRLGSSNVASEQAFQLEGLILGPYGVIPIAMAGCASLRAAPC